MTFFHEGLAMRRHERIKSRVKPRESHALEAVVQCPHSANEERCDLR